MCADVSHVQVHVETLAATKLEKHKNLGEEFSFFWREIDEGSLAFDRVKIEVSRASRFCLSTSPFCSIAFRLLSLSGRANFCGSKEGKHRTAVAFQNRELIIKGQRNSTAPESLSQTGCRPPLSRCQSNSFSRS